MTSNTRVRKNGFLNVCIFNKILPGIINALNKYACMDIHTYIGTYYMLHIAQETVAKQKNKEEGTVCVCVCERERVVAIELQFP